MSIDYKEIKVGDIHYEYSCGIEIIVEVISEPTKKIYDNHNGKDRYQYKWSSKITKSNGMTIGSVVDYVITEGLEHYGPKLYDYQAYIGMK